MLDYGAPFSFLFKNNDWPRKFLIASLLTYTLVGAAPVFGWMIEIVRRVGSGKTGELPELNDWKNSWKLGGQFALVNALWLLPLLLAAIVIYLPLVFADKLPRELLLAAWGGTLCCVLVFLLIYSVVYVFFIPAMLALLTETGSAWQAANPLRLWRTVRPQFTEYLIVFLIVGVALFNVVLLLGTLTLFLLLPPLLVYASLVTAHFAGQLMRAQNTSFPT